MNPCTAYRLLRDFVELKPGDIILQNGANSAVGKAVIQLAKVWKYKTVNIVRDRPSIEQMKTELLSLGADAVLTEQEFRKDGASCIATLSKERSPRLAFNCIGGKSATELLRHLGESGTMVTYGGMSKEPVQIGTRTAIFQDVILRGFWLSGWTEKHSKEEIAAMFRDIFGLIREKKFKIATKTYDLCDYQKALTEALGPYKEQKVIFSMDSSLKNK